MRTVLPLFLEDMERLAVVLDTCCELHGGAPGELAERVQQDRELAIKLVHASLSCCDYARVIRSLDLETLSQVVEQETEPAGEDPSDPFTVQEKTVVDMALRFRVTPQDVMQWPYEMLLHLVELWPYLGIKPKPDVNDPSQWVTADTISGLPGIAVVRE